jgi:hypothetical protein
MFHYQQFRKSVNREHLPYNRTMHLKIAVLFFLLLPNFSRAGEATLLDILVNLDSFINSIIAFLVGIAVLGVVWGLVKYIFQADQPEAHKAALRIIIGGVISIVVIIAIWGIIRFILTLIFGSSSPAFDPPSFPTLPTTITPTTCPNPGDTPPC